MQKGCRLAGCPRWTTIFVVMLIAGALAFGLACSRSDSGRDESPAGPSSPYRLTITASPSEIYPYDHSLIMIDVKNGYGEELDEPVAVNVTAAGGFFENGDSIISGEVVDNACFWLRYDPDHSPNGDFPGQKIITAIIDYGADSSYVIDTVEVVFLPQGDRVSQIVVNSDRSVITDADNGYAVISATVIGEHGASITGVSVYFAVTGGANATFDSDVVITNAEGTAQTVFRSNGDVGLLKVCGTAGSRSDCVEIRSEKNVE
ncbi:hypothetical protein J7M28_01190 [bacterium]|nr:hypothetical protein [bacterium]